MANRLHLRPPRDTDELYLAVLALWGVSIPRERVCPDHVAPMDAFADAYFRRNTINDSGINSLALWHGSRGLSGKSFMLSILGLTVACLLGSDVNLLGGSFAQSANIHEHMRNALDFPDAPRYMVVHSAATEMRFTNKARLRPLTASQRTVRGPHPATLLCDEIDEMDLPILDAALGQPMRQKNWLGVWINPYTVMCSTWQNPEGTFTEIKRRAEERGIPQYAWCFRETAAAPTGWLTEEGIAEKRASIPAEMWRVEYELGEPSIGNRAITTECVDACFSWGVTPIHQKVERDLEEYVFELPTRGAKYVASADWAKEQDKTVIQVTRVEGEHRWLAYFVRVSRRPYPVMIRMFNEAINRYDVGWGGAWHDSTGLGNVVNDYLDVRARPFTMTGDKRSVMLSDYVNAIEKELWHYPTMLKSAYLEHKYCRVGDLYKPSQDIAAAGTSRSTAERFHLPDTVCAGGLAEYAASRLQGPVNPITVVRGDDPGPIEREFTGPATDSPLVTADAPTAQWDGYARPAGVVHAGPAVFDPGV